MDLKENKEDLYESIRNLKILLLVLVVNALILVIMQASLFFNVSKFLESTLRMMSVDDPFRLKLEEYMRVASILQFPIALIYTSFPILTYLKLRRTYKTGKWSDIRTWFRFLGILSLISAFGIFFMIIIPFFGAFTLLSFPFLATGIILLRSLKDIEAGKND